LVLLEYFGQKKLQKRQNKNDKQNYENLKNQGADKYKGLGKLQT